MGTLIAALRKGKDKGRRFIKGLLLPRARCVFVGSTGRVGTTTLISLLDLSPRIDGAHFVEPLLGDEVKAAYHDREEKFQFYRKRFVEVRRDPIARAFRRGRIYVEAGLMAPLVPVIAEAAPKSKFIHLYRHPAGVIRSGMRRGYYNGHPWDRWRVEPGPDDPWRGEWDHWEPFAKTCYFWHRINAEMLAHRQALGEDRVMPLSFEDLVNPASGAWERVFRFIGAEPPPADQAVPILAQPHNAQTEGEFPTYEHWTDEQRRTLKRIAGPTMEALGYE